MKEQKKLSLKEMQELFCDYAFNRLPEEDRIVFEQNLVDFPELQQELHDVNQVFSKVETIEINKQISSRTRNMSIKVNERLSKESLFTRRRRIISKLLIPALGLATIIILIFSGNFNFIDTEVADIKKVTENDNFVGITTAEAKSVFEDDGEIIELASNLSNGLNHRAMENLAYLLSDEIDESYNSLLDNIMKTGDIFNENGGYHINSSNQYQIYNQLENLNEEEFQRLLEELENADFNS